MSEKRDIQALKKLIENLPLEEVCKVVISEIRSGVFRAQHGLMLMARMRSEDQQLTDEQQQFFTLAQEGVEEAIEAVEVLLVDCLLARIRNGD